jgi:hypothetical protein
MTTPASTTSQSASTPRSRFRRLFFRAAGLALGILLAATIVEALSTAYVYWKYRTLDLSTLMMLETSNAFVADQRTGYAATLYPHPYLGFVQNKAIEGDPQRTTQRLNNVGLIGRDFPLKKDPARFTILLTGGSVACQVGKAGEGGHSYLEKELNEKYKFDREVVVLNGGGAAWREPQQAILYLLYSDVVDAVVTLDGFNEHSHFVGFPTRLEYPSTNFHDLNPMVTSSYDQLGASWQCQQLKRFSLDHGWRSVYLATRYLRNRIEERAKRRTASHDISLESIFSLPAEWSKEQRTAFNLEQYKKYIRSIDALAKMNGVPAVHFIQPCPAIGKRLTEDERRVVGDLSYAGSYRRMESEVLGLNSAGSQVVSLTNVFEDREETLYEDPIHCRFGDVRNFSYEVVFIPSEAYRLVSTAMAEQVAEVCKVSRRAAP